MAFMAFVTAILVGLTSMGIGSGKQKAENQQTQPAQITYVSESAGTSNEPEQATKQNNEPVLAAEGKNDVTAPAAGINNELAQADEKNEPDVHESMPVYAPVVDEPTPEVIPEVDVDKQKDELAQEENVSDVHESTPADETFADDQAPEVIPEVDEPEQNDEPVHVTEEKSSPAAPETEQDKLSDATEFWRNRLKVDRTWWLRALDTDEATIGCRSVCDQTAILAGHDAAAALCGSRDANDPGRYYTYEKCANPSTAATTKAAAIERVDADIASFAPVLAEKVEVNDGKFDTVRLKDVLRAELKRRAHNHGCDLPFMDDAVDGSGYGLYYTLFDLSGEYYGVRSYLTAAASDAPCNWICDHVRSHVTPFCDANKNFPDCEQYLEKLAKCAANKDEL